MGAEAGGPDRSESHASASQCRRSAWQFSVADRMTMMAMVCSRHTSRPWPRHATDATTHHKCFPSARPPPDLPAVLDRRLCQ